MLWAKGAFYIASLMFSGMQMRIEMALGLERPVTVFAIIVIRRICKVLVQ